MTLPERSLHPARGDDRGAFLSALEFVAGTRLQLGEVVWTVVRQRVPLEPHPTTPAAKRFLALSFSLRRPRKSTAVTVAAALISTPATRCPAVSSTISTSTPSLSRK